MTISLQVIWADNNDIELIENLNEYSDEQIIEQIENLGILI